MYVVSRCLLGESCKYNGGHNYSQKVIDFLKDKDYIAVCPEELGGLPTPRTPCERCENKVINKLGEDKTKEFVLGANRAIDLIKDKDIKGALLQARSPSCGKGLIYDGTFSGKLVKGNGIFAEKLMMLGIEIKHEDELE